jgi:general secretion pathway protein L
MGGHTPFCVGGKDFITEYTMLKVFEEKLLQLFSWLKAGPAGKFLRWWTEELRQAMPASWQQKLQHALRRATLVVRNDSLSVGVDENRSLETLEVFSMAQDAVLQKQQVEDLLLKNELQEAPRFLLMELESVLNRELKLPLAAEANLAQVLSFEMDRQTPFRASDVYFDWKILGRNNDTGQLRLEIFVIPRIEVDQAVSAVTDRGFNLSGVDIIDGDKALGLNLLPAERRFRSVNRKARMNLALGAACAVLLAMVMAQSIYLREHQVAELEEAIAEVQGEAREVMKIKKQIEESSEAAGFLATRRAEVPLAIEVLADITRILPDDTYLDRLVITNSSVQLQGKSQNAQRLIELVNESGLLDEAAFRGSTRLDARSGLEIFEVNAEIVRSGAN